MTCIEDEDVTGNGDGYNVTELYLYKISENKKKKENLLIDKKGKKGMVPSKKVVKFLIN